MTFADLNAELIGRLDCKAALAEGVIWDNEADAVFWVDIEGARLCRARAPFETFEVFAAPERIGSIGLVEGRTDCLIAAFESGFALFHFETGQVDWLARPELASDVRFNDGRVDRMGRFWAGTMVETAARRHTGDGALFRLDGSGQASVHLKGIGISNSLCWSPDGATMYFADTPEKAIWSFDFQDGRPSGQAVFARCAAGAPDGSAVDADGCVWNAEWGAGRVVRYDAQGRILGQVPVPAPHVSCVAFGGAALDLLFVTTAQAEMSPEALERAPEAGSVFVYKTDCKGLPESRWRPFE